MYKVFFKDRIIFLQKEMGEPEGSGSYVYYQYQDPAVLTRLVDTFIHASSLKYLYVGYDSPEVLWQQFCTGFQPITAGGGLVRNEKNEILLIKRNGLWDLPKGKAEKGESIGRTAEREVMEECGISGIKMGELLIKTYHIYMLKESLILKETFWFNMHYAGNEVPLPQTEEGITEIHWVNPFEADFIKKNTYLSILEVLKQGKVFS